MLGKCSYFFVVLRHGRSCQEMCGTILWVGKQDDSTTLQGIYSLHRLPSFQIRRIEICRRIVTSLLSNCSEMLILGTYWKTWYSMVRNLHDRSQLDQSLWKKIISFDLTFILHVSTNSVVMWETLPNNADWDCFKTPILQEILRIQSPLLEEHCAFLEVIHLFQSVGCVRNKLHFRTVQQNQKSFLWMQDWGWMVSRHLIYGIWSSKFLETRIRVIQNRATC